MPPGTHAGWMTAALSLLAGCLGPTAHDCGNAILCPGELKCADAAPFCVSPSCGNGRLDPGESCDDGNNNPGDDCPADCGRAHCGNGVVEPGEACDDGNTVSGDGCSASCRTVELCGNHVMDSGETCDDGNLRDHDGCSSRCILELPTWTPLVPGPSMSIPARESAGWAYSPAQDRLILFGGDTSAGHINDTWSWDATNWLRYSLEVDGSPSARAAFAITTVAGVVTIFGGSSTTRWEGDELWALRGQRWLRETRPTTPVGRRYPAMAYDPSRNRTVMFGGAGGIFSDSLADTWELDDVDWVERTPIHAPDHRLQHAMTYHAGRQHVVLYGGYSDEPFFHTVYGDLWEWTGTDWSAPPQDFGPPGRAAAALAYDPVRDKLVLFGGRTPADDTHWAPMNDTWEWDGARWHEQSPATVPPARTSHVMAYDPRRGRVVMFGGVADAVYFDDLWEWDGADWQRRYFLTPQPRARHAMAFEPSRATLVMFGGIDRAGHAQDDTWVWDGSNWHRPSLERSPAARTDHAMAHDAKRAATVLFGGTGSHGELLGDTWEWDGVSWIERGPVAGPSARAGHAMVYDDRHLQVLLFGGTPGASAAALDQWAWDGSKWTHAESRGSLPAARSDFAVAYDTERETFVLFGGQGTSSLLGDLWEQHQGQWTAITALGSPHPGPRAGHTLVYDPALQRVVLFGGRDDTGILDDAWAWDGAQWRRLTPQGPRPAARQHHAMVHDAVRELLVLFSGNTDDADANRLWTLRYLQP